jgi:hypothetical protein
VDGLQGGDWAEYLRRLIGHDREFGQAVLVVAQLGIADLVKDGPRHLAELAELTRTHEPSLYRVLRYLASRGLFAEDSDGRFSITAGAQPLQADSADSIMAEVRWNGSEVIRRSWDNLGHSVRTGQTAFDYTFGRPFFDHLADDQEFARVFNDAMTTGSVDEGPDIVAAHDFSRYGTVVDVGGGHGALLALILDRYPDVRGVLFDAPDVVAGARGAIDRHVAVGRATRVGGSFFEAVPSGGDAYLLKHIVHDWDDEQALSILTNCRTAMAPNGRVLIVEMVVPAGNAEAAVKHLDVTMLVFTGGRERTEREYRDLLAGAGLRLLRSAATESSFSILEAVADHEGQAS